MGVNQKRWGQGLLLDIKCVAKGLVLVWQGVGSLGRWMLSGGPGESRKAQREVAGEVALSGGPVWLSRSVPLGVGAASPVTLLLGSPPAFRAGQIHRPLQPNPSDCSLISGLKLALLLWGLQERQSGIAPAFPFRGRDKGC